MHPGLLAVAMAIFIEGASSALPIVRIFLPVSASRQRAMRTAVACAHLITYILSNDLLLLVWSSSASPGNTMWFRVDLWSLSKNVCSVTMYFVQHFSVLAYSTYGAIGCIVRPTLKPRS